MELLQSKTWKNVLILCFIFDQIFAYPKNEICLTKGCIKAASEILDAMDTTVDPCDNFYNFACGNYIKKSNLINEYDKNSAMGDMQLKVWEQLRTILSEPINFNEIEPYKIVKTFYSQCMYDTGTESFLEMMERFGGWPILKGENWNETDFKFSEFISEMQKYQPNNYLFVVRINSEFIYVSRTLPSDNDYSDTDEYRNYMKYFLTLLGSENNAEIDQIFNFEKKLEEIHEEKNKTVIDKNDKIVTMTMKKFQDQNKYLKWTNYFEETQEIHVNSPNYFKRLGQLIESTPERTLANYLMWNFAKTSAKDLSQDIHHLNAKYQYTKKNDVTTAMQTLRWMFCLKEITANLPLSLPLSAMYVEKHFGTQVKPNVKEMIKAIRTEAVYTFQEAEWMNKTTQEAVLKKLDDLEFKYVGFLNELMDSVKIKRSSENLHLGSDLFQSSLKLRQYMLYDMKNINPLQNEYLYMPPFLVNANYGPLFNSINFPAAILQSPKYNTNQPQYINYGKTGWVIAHEIAHMFGNGRKYLGKDRVNCIIKQYSSYVEKSINKTLNGAKTIEEDLADNIGVKLAYRTYTNYINYVGEELKLPGLNYTPEQLFWIAGAQGWCANQGVGLKEMLLTSDEHTLASWRVLGTFRNMVEFSGDFQCSLNSKMNPSKRCEIWK